LDFLPIHSGFGDAVTEYLESRSDLRDTTLASYKYTLEKVFAPLHGNNLADITTKEISAIISEKGAAAVRMHRANLSAFWRWAAKLPRGWCQKDVLEALEARRESNDKDIEILRPDDVRALLTAAEAEGHGAAVAYAVAVFAGVRSHI